MSNGTKAHPLKELLASLIALQPKYPVGTSIQHKRNNSRNIDEVHFRTIHLCLVLHFESYVSCYSNKRLRWYHKSGSCLISWCGEETKSTQSTDEIVGIVWGLRTILWN